MKIGSSALTSLSRRARRRSTRRARRRDRGTDACRFRRRRRVVRGGGRGLAPLGLTKRPRDLATKQAAASVGQLALAHAWGTSFARYGRTVGQVLLTADDIARRAQHRNAQRTLDRLRALHAVAIVNENDTVATAELRFGDNDRLAALVAHLVGADALVLLSDVDGLYDGDPRKGNATLIPEVNSPEDLDGVVAGSGGALGTGGMASKLSAARLAADCRCAGAARRRPDAAAALRDAGRRHGVRGPADPVVGAQVLGAARRGRAGAPALDAGAVRAVVDRRRSLLPAGITGGVGAVLRRRRGVAPRPRRRPVARGSGGLRLGGARRDARQVDPGTAAEMQRPVVHADDLVPL